MAKPANTRLERGPNGLHPRAFGVYRPLAADFAETFVEVVEGVVNETWHYLHKRGRRDAQNMYIHDDFGVTFVSRREVSRSFTKGLLKNGGYDPQEAVETVGLYDLLDIREMEVPLEGLGWFKPNDLKAGSLLNVASAAGATLSYQSKLVGAWVDHMCGQEADFGIREPNHLSFMRLGCDYRAQAGPLEEFERREVARIAERRLYREGITALTLGPLVVGESYSRVHPDFRGVFTAPRAPAAVGARP